MTASSSRASPSNLPQGFLDYLNGFASSVATAAVNARFADLSADSKIIPFRKFLIEPAPPYRLVGEKRRKIGGG